MPAPSIATRVRSVVVHGNGALVTRVGRVEKGADEVLIEGLPLLFASDTLRVRPKSDACVIGVVDEVCRVGVVPAAAVSGEEALLEVRIQISALELKKRTLTTLLDHADLRVELPPKDVAGMPEIAALLRLAQGGDRRRRGLVAELRAIEDEQRKLRKEERRLAHDVKPDEKPPRVLRGLRVGVDASEASDVEVEYFVPAARWVPSYALHLTSAPLNDAETKAATRARLVLGALVAQATGEDWDDVELRVSTVDLRRETTLPVLHSWRLGRAQPAKARGFRPLPSDLPTLFSGWDRFPGPPPPPPAPKPAAHATTPSTTLAATTEQGEYQMRSEGELRSFEHQKTNASIEAMPRDSMKDAAYDEDDLSAEESVDEGGAAGFGNARADDGVDALSALRAPMGGMAPQNRPAPAPSAAPMEKSMMLAKKSKGGAASTRTGMMFAADLGVAPGGHGGGGNASPLVVDELPPRLRTSAMRMGAPSETQRGLLLPLDAQKRLEWLLEASELGADPKEGEGARHELRRAIAGLDDAARRLRSRPLPRGTTAIAGGGVSAVFGSATSRASIPGDGNDHRVEVHVDEGEAGILHLAVPRESLDVWRACRFQPKGALPPGPVQVYEDGAFVVAARVDGGGGGKPLIVNLGVDPEVRIKARTPTALQSEKGMLGGTTHMEHKVVTELRSTKQARVELRLFDRVPVVDEHQREVLVSAVTSKPPPAVVDKGPKDETLKGGLRFDVILMPGEARTIEHSYTITLPAKSEVVGGNRRE